MAAMQKNIIIIGIIIIIIGIFWPLITYLRFGNLPGDIVIKKNNFTFYFPIMTSLIISLACILISYFFKK
jgi:amino acid permease